MRILALFLVFSAFTALLSSGLYVPAPSVVQAYISKYSNINYTNWQHDWMKKRVSVGTWNVGLYPWMNASAIIDSIPKDLDVLALEGVWDPSVAAEIVQQLTGPSTGCDNGGYRNSYYVPANNGTQIGCMNSNPECANYGLDSTCSLTFAAGTIQCLQDTGVNTTTFIPSELDPESPCYSPGGFLLTVDPMCFACITVEMQKNTVSNAMNAFGTCAAGAGSEFSFGGNAGILILSNKRVTNVTVQEFESYIVRRVVVFATIDEIQYAFSDFPYDFNLPAPIPPPPQDLQPVLAQAMLNSNADFLVGDFNSGPDFQPSAYSLIVSGGYDDLASGVDTFCTAELATDPRCDSYSPLAIDHVFINSDYKWFNNRCRGAYHLFNNELGLSDHAGLRVKGCIRVPNCNHHDWPHF